MTNGGAIGPRSIAHTWRGRQPVAGSACNRPVLPSLELAPPGLSRLSVGSPTALAAMAPFTVAVAPAVVLVAPTVTPAMSAPPWPGRARWTRPAVSGPIMPRPAMVMMVVMALARRPTLAPGPRCGGREQKGDGGGRARERADSPQRGAAVHIRRFVGVLSGIRGVDVNATLSICHH